MMLFCDMQPFKVWVLMQKLGVITLFSDMCGRSIDLCGVEIVSKTHLTHCKWLQKEHLSFPNTTPHTHTS